MPKMSPPMAMHPIAAIWYSDARAFLESMSCFKGLLLMINGLLPLGLLSTKDL